MTEHAKGCQGREYTCTCGYDAKVDELIRTATELVEDMNKLGYGYSAERPLPGAYDPFLKALEDVKR